MNLHRRIAPFVTISLIGMAALVASCSDKSTPTGGGTPRELNSGSIPNGGVFAHTFANAGTYNYFCTIHGAGMAGTVVVAGGQPANASVSIQNNSYNPATVSVAPGGMVTWTNNGSPHTVTSN